MKKFIFSAVALMAFSFAGMANDIEETKSENQLVVSNIENTTSVEEIGSLKCWAFGKWLKTKLNAVSDDDALIDQTVDAAVGLCNILDDVGII